MRPVVVFCMLVLPIACAPVEFEVASIRPASLDSHGASTNWGGPTFSATGYTVKSLIERAYNLQAFEVVGGPAWLDRDRFDITAKAPDGVKTTRELLPGMLQALLRDRFNLKLHRETRQATILALVVHKDGLRIKADATERPASTSTGPGRITGANRTLESLAFDLSGRLEQKVVDKTGVAGRFDYKLEWEADSAKGDGPSLFTALQEQLGLRLEPQKAPVEFLVVDGVTLPTEN